MLDTNRLPLNAYSIPLPVALPEAKMPDFAALAAKAMRGELDDEDGEEEDDAADRPREADAAADRKEAAVTADADMSSGTPSDEELLTILHTLLLDTHVTEGELVCGGCKRHYKIQQGILNMRLNEDEV